MSSLAEVLDVRLLTREERSEAQRLEDLAEESGAAGGIMPFVNEGIHAALASDAVFAVTTGPMTNEPPTPWTIMVDEDDQVIGEWLSESRIAEARENKRCIFLSDDFVMYKDPRPRGKSRFVMPFICLPLKGDDSRFTVCGVGSPSTPGDEYIRSLMGSPGSDVATLLLGVCFR
ncbi:MAG: hypothetical protein MUQ56_12455 [Thermoleophilia bacterium]|nr:hypothetical protein [Thermoleophilia bacterium]